MLNIPDYQFITYSKEDLEITEELTTKGVIIKNIALKIDFNKTPKK